jgi:hypothetical protein
MEKEWSFFEKSSQGMFSTMAAIRSRRLRDRLDFSYPVGGSKVKLDFSCDP